MLHNICIRQSAGKIRDSQVKVQANILGGVCAVYFQYRSAPPEIEDKTWRKLMKVYKNNPRHIDPFTGFQQH